MVLGLKKYGCEDNEWWSQIKVASMMTYIQACWKVFHLPLQI